MEQTKKTLGTWAFEQNIRLLDESFYKDENLYTIEEYEKIVPRDIEVPLNNETFEDRKESTINGLLQELQNLDIQKKSIDERMSKIKETLEKDYLTTEGYKNDIVTISYTSASETTSIDLKQLEEKEPELFKDLVKDYTKVTKRKASYSYRFK